MGSGGATPNRPPIVANPNENQRIAAGQLVSYDATQGGVVFSDPDGDPLHYTVTLGTSVQGLSVAGTSITGRTSSDATGSVAVSITATDGRGGSATNSFLIDIFVNGAPVSTAPDILRIVDVGVAADIDVARDNATFRDPEGGPLQYAVSLAQPSNGLSVAGTHITGIPAGAAVTRVSVRATDQYGAAAEKVFSIVAAATASSRPVLTTPGFVYEDAQLPLPYMLRLSGESRVPLWDTTPLSNPITNAGATLGRVLFYDKRLSITNSMSCASCHEQSHGFASSSRFNTGVMGVPLTRQAMPLANVRYNMNDLYFSDTRVATLEQLALMPIQEPMELGSPLDQLVSKLAATDFYPPLFNSAFGTPEISSDRIARALAQFLRSMISYRSPKDRATLTMENGNVPQTPPYQFTAQEQRGWNIYVGKGCVFCHSDDVHTNPSPANNGLDAVFTDPGAGGGRFRAASLQNIAVTGPYMHDGRFSTLREVIDHYDHGIQFSADLAGLLTDRGQPLRLNLSEDDKLALEAFLGTLTDNEFLTDPKFSNPFP